MTLLLECFHLNMFGILVGYIIETTVTAASVYNASVGGGIIKRQPGGSTNSSICSYCNITVSYNHMGKNDIILTPSHLDATMSSGDCGLRGQTGPATAPTSSVGTTRLRSRAGHTRSMRPSSLCLCNWYRDCLCYDMML